jgi:hypothetical protein
VQQVILEQILKNSQLSRGPTVSLTNPEPAGEVDAVQMKQQLLNHGMELTAMRAVAHAARWVCIANQNGNDDDFLHQK